MPLQPLKTEPWVFDYSFSFLNSSLMHSPLNIPVGFLSSVGYESRAVNTFKNKSFIIFDNIRFWCETPYWIAACQFHRKKLFPDNQAIFRLEKINLTSKKLFEKKRNVINLMQFQNLTWLLLRSMRYIIQGEQYGRFCSV